MLITSSLLLFLGAFEEPHIGGRDPFPLPVYETDAADTAGEAGPFDQLVLSLQVNRAGRPLAPDSFVLAAADLRVALPNAFFDYLLKKAGAMYWNAPLQDYDIWAGGITDAARVQDLGIFLTESWGLAEGDSRLRREAECMGADMYGVIPLLYTAAMIEVEFFRDDLDYFPNAEGVYMILDRLLEVCLGEDHLRDLAGRE